MGPLRGGLVWFALRDEGMPAAEHLLAQDMPFAAADSFPDGRLKAPPCGSVKGDLIFGRGFQNPADFHIV